MVIAIEADIDGDPGRGRVLGRLDRDHPDNSVVAVRRRELGGEDQRRSQSRDHGHQRPDSTSVHAHLLPNLSRVVAAPAGGATLGSSSPDG